jgi:hypothetical protein
MLLVQARDVMRTDLLLFLEREATFKEIATVVALARQVHSLERKTGSYRMNSIRASGQWSPASTPEQWSPASSPGSKLSHAASVARAKIQAGAVKAKINTVQAASAVKGAARAKINKLKKKKKEKVANLPLSISRKSSMGSGMRAYIARRKTQGAGTVSHAGVDFENVLVPVVNTGDDMIFMGCCRVSDLEDLLTQWRQQGNKPLSPRPEMFQAEPGNMSGGMGGRRASSSSFDMGSKQASSFAMGGKRGSFDMSGRGPGMGGAKMSMPKGRLRRQPSLASIIQGELVVTHAANGAAPEVGFAADEHDHRQQMLMLRTPPGTKPPKLSRPSLDKLKKFGFDVEALVKAVESEYEGDAFPAVSPEQEGGYSDGLVPAPGGGSGGINGKSSSNRVVFVGGGSGSSGSSNKDGIKNGIMHGGKGPLGRLGRGTSFAVDLAELYAEGEAVEATIAGSTRGEYIVAVVTRVSVMGTTGETVYDLVHEDGRVQSDVSGNCIRRQPGVVPPVVPPVIPPKASTRKTHTRRQSSGDNAIAEAIAAASAADDDAAATAATAAAATMGVSLSSIQSLNKASIQSMTKGVSGSSSRAIRRVKGGSAHRKESMPPRDMKAPHSPAPSMETNSPGITAPAWLGAGAAGEAAAPPPAVPPLPRHGRMSIPDQPAPSLRGGFTSTDSTASDTPLLRSGFASNDSNASDRLSLRQSFASYDSNASDVYDEEPYTEEHVATYKIGDEFEITLRREADHKSTLTGVTLEGGSIFQTVERRNVPGGRPCGGDQVFLRLAPDSQDMVSASRRNSTPALKGVQWAFMYHPTNGSGSRICEELQKPQLPPKPKQMSNEEEEGGGGVSIDVANGESMSGPRRVPMQEWVGSRTSTADGPASNSDTDSDIGSLGDDDDAVVVVVEEDGSEGEESGQAMGVRSSPQRASDRMSNKSRTSLDEALGSVGVSGGGGRSAGGLQPAPSLVSGKSTDSDDSTSSTDKKQKEQYDLLKLLRTRDDFNHPNVTKMTPLPHVCFLFHAHRCSRIFICEKVGH